jgi:hypothetical protein
MRNGWSNAKKRCKNVVRSYKNSNGLGFQEQPTYLARSPSRLMKRLDFVCKAYLYVLSSSLPWYIVAFFYDLNLWGEYSFSEEHAASAYVCVNVRMCVYV